MIGSDRGIVKDNEIQAALLVDLHQHMRQRLVGDGLDLDLTPLRSKHAIGKTRFLDMLGGRLGDHVLNILGVNLYNFFYGLADDILGG